MDSGSENRRNKRASYDDSGEPKVKNIKYLDLVVCTKVKNMNTRYCKEEI